MRKALEPVTLGQAVGLGLLVAVVVLILMLFGMGSHAQGGGVPPIALGAGFYYAANALVLGLVARLAGVPTPRRLRRVTVRSVMLVIAVGALNLLFLRFWAGRDAFARKTLVDWLQGWSIAAAILPLGFLLSLFNSACLLLGLSRAGADRPHAGPTADELG